MKLILSFLFKILHLFGVNTRVINFLSDKKFYANNSYNFENSIQMILNDRKLIALDAGSQGGFNSDSFFSKKYDKYFEPILVDPLQRYPDKSFLSLKHRREASGLDRHPTDPLSLLP